MPPPPPGNRCKLLSNQHAPFYNPDAHHADDVVIFPQTYPFKPIYFIRQMNTEIKFVHSYMKRQCFSMDSYNVTTSYWDLFIYSDWRREWLCVAAGWLISNTSSPADAQLKWNYSRESGGRCVSNPSDLRRRPRSGVSCSSLNWYAIFPYDWFIWLTVLLPLHPFIIWECESIAIRLGCPCRVRLNLLFKLHCAVPAPDTLTIIKTIHD